jgi:hypothetical protein
VDLSFPLLVHIRSLENLWERRGESCWHAYLNSSDNLLRNISIRSMSWTFCFCFGRKVERSGEPWRLAKPFAWKERVRRRVWSNCWLRGLLQCVTSKPSESTATIHQTGEIADTVNELARWYSSHRVAFVSLVFSNPTERIHTYPEILEGHQDDDK